MSNSEFMRELSVLETADRVWEYARPDEILYHYTDIHGVKGILENKQFWISNQNFLNDSSEIKYLSNLLAKTIKDLHEIYTETHMKNFLDEYENYCYNAFERDHGDAYLNMRIKTNDNLAFILSLSSNPDSLMLWSMYSKFRGYNIGFKFYELYDYFSKCDEIKIILHARVIYDTEKQLKIIRDEIEKFIGLYQKYMKLNIDKHLIFSILNARLWIYSLIFKNNSFSNEQEYRVIFFPNDKKISTKYRVSNDGILPFITCPSVISDELLPLVNITVGPKNHLDTNEEGIKYFLDSLQYDIDNINIVKSNIPLRY